MSFLEIIAASMGVLSVWYAKKNNVLVFPTGIVSVLIYVYITYQNKIYAESGINIYYFMMSVYGWILWTSKNKKIKKNIALNTSRENLVYFILFILFFIILFFLLNKTDSDVVFLDSITTALSLTAMLLLARRKVENWIYWILADIIYIPLFFYKELYVTSLQYLIFLILAISGYNNWKRNISNDKNHNFMLISIIYYIDY